MIDPNKRRPRLGRASISLVCAVAIAAGCAPAAAYAEASSAAEDFAESAYDVAYRAGHAIKAALFGRAASDDGIGLLSYDTTVDLGASVSPYSFTSEMMYSSEFESGSNYDQGFSYEDSYHALGCYQFDNRYGLQDFLIACYNYDPGTFWMLGWLRTDDLSLNLAGAGNMYDYSAGRLTELGQRVEDSWHGAYAANPDLFSRLQDGWFYQEYYETAISYCNSRGYNMDNRRDCVKGLVAGMCNLFGSSGMRHFLGGFCYCHYQEWPGANLNGDMSDYDFVVTLCDYISENVVREDFGIKQAYASSYANRYQREKATCLDYLSREPEPAPVPTPNPSDGIVINSSGYTDVPDGSWYYEAVVYVNDKGVMSGWEEGGKKVFQPDGTITRGMVVTILWRMVGSPTADSSTEAFNDVDYGKYYGNAIRWARSRSIVGGVGDNRFNPDGSITREELAIMLANFAGAIDGKNTGNDGASLSSFSDGSQVDSWARAAMGWAVDEGIITGKNGISLDPHGTATRAEAATVFMRYLKSR